MAAATSRRGSLDRMTRTRAREIPDIDIGALFEDDGPERHALDRTIMAAAAGSGFMTVHGLPESVPLSAAHRREMLRIFQCADEELRPCWRRKFDPQRSALYRGWFPAQPGALSYKRGIDMGPDVAHGREVTASDDPLREPTPIPEGQGLDGWRDAVAAYYEAMERTGRVLMQSLARGMGLDQHAFDDAFRGGISTLRLIEYPPRPEEALERVDPDRLWVEHAGRRYQVIGKAHVDSGLLTLLAQDGVPGLQARLPSGEWCDVPPAEGTLAVNFGKLLQDWTGGRIRATEHRVLGSGELRHSVPFFYEPHVDAVIRPLTDDVDFEPFLYGDHLWDAMTGFVEFEGMEHLRPPRGEGRGRRPD